MDDQAKIKNLNQLVAVATGRIDVIYKMIEEGDVSQDNLSSLKAYVRKSKENIDEMVKRFSEGRNVVD